MKKPFTVLFLCTGNSCRSQMAEAIVNNRLSPDCQAFSAGTKPAGYVHPMARSVLDEIGITHEGESKQVSAFADRDFDLVVTVCDSAAEDCPLWLKGGTVVHLPFEDPAKLTGSQEQVMQVFRRVRDEIAAQVPELVMRFQEKYR